MRLLLTIIVLLTSTPALAAEYNPVRLRPVSIGPQANRFLVGFRATSSNAQTQVFRPRSHVQSVRIMQARTTAADVDELIRRTRVAAARTRQITPSMHVVYMQRMLYGADVLSALAALRADPAVKFADVDERRYASAVPDDPLFGPTSGATGQWYLLTPSTGTGDLSAIDAVSAWDTSKGDATTVIAVVDTGVRYDHPDLLRVGSGGRLLPGYDFVDQDYSTTDGTPLHTFLGANDGDGWDSDPSDPGDWINAADQGNALFSGCAVEDSSWHGTRVAGILGALTDNAVGVAGLTWSSHILPVRVLGKCGGYDSDIIAGVEWAAGMDVSTATNPVPINPFPADIINLSLGSSSDCSQSYQDAFNAVTQLGAVIVAAAGNESGPVGAPANCSAFVPGVIAVAGLRHVGTKVGYSSLGAEVSVSAPAGNCINATGACLRSIDTTVNQGLTGPGSNSYTNQTNRNIGTSFSAPIVAGIVALMRSANDQLTPAQVAALLEASATPFPANVNSVAVCPASDPDTGECSCPASGQCGTGMANAKSAVAAALTPIVAPVASLTFAPASVLSGTASQLTISISNDDMFALTQTNLTASIASGLTIAATPVISTSCGGAQHALTVSGQTVMLSNAVVPANGTCSVTLSVSSSTAGSYTQNVSSGAVTTAAAGSNSTVASASLTITAPAKKSGGGAVSWLDVSLLSLGVVWLRSRPRRQVRA